MTGSQPSRHASKIFTIGIILFAVMAYGLTCMFIGYRMTRSRFESAAVEAGSAHYQWPSNRFQFIDCNPFRRTSEKWEIVPNDND
jgi:hypothetical protein